MATWQCARYCHDEILREEKHPLLINIDESPMPLVYANAMGNILRGLGPHADRCKEPRRGASRQEQRVHYTFVAMICNNHEIQKLLPQVIIVPQRILPIAAWTAIDNELPENVYLARQPSMWVNATLYAKILRLLRKCLKRYNVQHRHRVVVMADAFGGHPTLRAVRAITYMDFISCCSPLA